MFVHRIFCAILVYALFVQRIIYVPIFVTRVEYDIYFTFQRPTYVKYIYMCYIRFIKAYRKMSSRASSS